MKNNKGFSLVELIVVIAIMAILAAVAIPTFAGFISKANVAADVDFFNNAEYAAELALAATGEEVAYVYVKLGDDKQPIEIQINGIVIDENGAKAAEGQSLTDADKAFAKDVADTIDWDYTFKSVEAGKTCALVGNKINDTVEFAEPEVEEPEVEEPAEE